MTENLDDIDSHDNEKTTTGNHHRFQSARREELLEFRGRLAEQAEEEEQSGGTITQDMVVGETEYPLNESGRPYILQKHHSQAQAANSATVDRLKLTTLPFSSESTTKVAEESPRPLPKPLKVNRLGSGQLRKFGRLAKKTPQVVLPRNRSILMNRRMPLLPAGVEHQGQERRDSSRVVGSDFGSDFDELSSSRGSQDGGLDAYFIWEGLQPMAPTPEMFPYYELTGASVMGGVSSAGSRSSSGIRTH